MSETGGGRQAEVAGAFTLGGKLSYLRGNVLGLRGPLLRGTLNVRPGFRPDPEALGQALRRLGGISETEIEGRVAGGFAVDDFLAIVKALESKVSTPVVQAGLVTATATASDGTVRHAFLIPTCRPEYTSVAVGVLSQCVDACVPTTAPQQREAVVDLACRRLEAARARHRLRFGVNDLRIARAAHELDLPMRWIPERFLHIGAGIHARIFRSTLTESTPALAVALARSKSSTASLLRFHGLPVPRHRVVSSLDEALAAARSLGYPVVLKPDDLDGGVGVHAGLESESQLRACFPKTAAVAERMLVEKHVDGMDHRLTVENGRIVKAIVRRPGGVVGDGASSVSALIDAIVAAAPHNLPRKSLPSLDDEALAMLAERGMDARSVPPKDVFVALRRRGNMSTGGTAADVLDRIHPDNADIAVRAARALRLDIAGIDLIIPDIAVSWMDSVAGICEVNAMPQISTQFAPEVYRDLLRREVGPPGRLRSVLFVDFSGGRSLDRLVRDAAAALERDGERVVSVLDDGVWMDGRRIAPAAGDRFDAAVSAEFNRDATAVVVAMPAGVMLRDGLPWLHVEQSTAVGLDDRREAVAAFRALTTAFAPHLVGPLRVDEGWARRHLGPDELARLSLLSGERADR